MSGAPIKGALHLRITTCFLNIGMMRTCCSGMMTPDYQEVSWSPVLARLNPQC
ncbi:MAG: hypothetical protein R3E36_00165 [Nitrosomonas sp.]|nr:hypothetical protein [Nitrosomonas sp.]MCP5252084.1 hypothetical protein [Burkholderiales bacterium]MDR4519031.1 hypothetical protein [Nitrosomonas sp.]